MRPPSYAVGPHLQRWIGLGFDPTAAAARFTQFRAALAAAAATGDAIAIIADYVARERRLVRAEGVPEADPDLWRIDALPKYIAWERAGEG